MKSNFSSAVFILTFTFILSISAVDTKAQVQIFGLAGYQTNSNVTVASGELNFKDDMTYGLGFDVDVDRQTKLEVSWSMSATHVDLNEYLGTTYTITDLNIHHFQGGALYEPPSNKKVSPFGLFSLGATWFQPSDANISDEVRFSIALGGGVKVDLSDKVGLRFQGRLIIPMQFGGGSIYVGTGGSGVSVGAYTYFVEADFTGGLFFRL
jgi:opacity protein-like surface antigen